MIDNAPLVSIVVPVYNVEKYLRKCLDSLVNQTYKNIEIITVNDGSTDSSLTILDEYAKNYKNITIVNKSNGGLASARNAGVKIAKGEYIWNVDSDDYADLHALDNMVNTALLNDSDIVVSGYKLVDYNYKIYGKRTPRFIGNIYGEEALIKMLRHEIGGEVWTKIYKRDLYINYCIKQDEIFSQAEDVMLNFQMFSHALTITACDSFTIYHVLRKGSYSDNSKTLKFRLYHYKGIESLANYGFISKQVKEAYDGFILLEFLSVLKFRNFQLIQELSINQLEIKRQFENIVYLPFWRIKQHLSLIILYFFVSMRLHGLIAGIINKLIKTKILFNKL